jgi:hypothetical protein
MQVMQCRPRTLPRMRKLYKTNTSGYRGVYLCKKTGTWRATIQAGGARVSLGYYERAEAAARAYNAAALEYFGAARAFLNAV